ncbi:hypothetical protein, partial [Streptomyces hilarionis]|uniref:hypothetical protein n=1 Tax=Streptomyces hilarionis TaxID=2839954 RepID=UPI00211A8C9D|nr:hypothetical protein [Streptomyces hilarionis]
MISQPRKTGPTGTSSLSRTEDFTGWPWRQGQTGNQPGVTTMEATIISGAWKGHLGRGLAPKELQY